ncbi:hypothetical protein ACFXAW_00845 [Streptomyces sp. NPDC059445]|uniref:hypothetical protein n=1 Tax=Streptomyces sp. NPDC059445 TaxID=3346832 RepID=UPI00369DF6F0
MTTPSQGEFSGLADPPLRARGRLPAALAAIMRKVSDVVLGPRAIEPRPEGDPSLAASRLTEPKRPTDDAVVRERLRYEKRYDIGPGELAERRQEVMRLAHDLREQATVPSQQRPSAEGLARSEAFRPAEERITGHAEESRAAAVAQPHHRARTGGPVVVGVLAGLVAATAIADISQASGGQASAGAAVFVSAGFLCMLVMTLVGRTATLLRPLLRPKILMLVGGLAVAQWSFYMLYERP